MTDHPAPRPISWNDGGAYEAYVGRWSRQIAPEFIHWLGIASSADWLDVGCGTGALSEAILRDTAPASVFGVDLSAAHVDYARAHVVDPRARFEIADAQSLPVESAAYDVAVSGLVINFVPDPDKALSEMARAVKRGGTIALYLWAQAGGMQMMATFWEAAAALNPDAPGPELGRRYPLSQPEQMVALLERAGLEQVEVRSIEIAMQFENFNAYWTPFLAGQGSGPRYLLSLPEPQQVELREAVRARLPVSAGGSIALTARVWAVRGRRP
jgi:SAM-dependent methyltransferase